MNGLALTVSMVVIGITLVATYLAARRSRTADEFWTAGGGLSGRTNGIAIAGDFLSSSSLLGYAGLAFLFGLDGVLYGAAASGIFLMVLFLLAEKMRNLGRFTFADALALRLRARPVRAVSAVSALCVCIFYLLAQLVGGGVLLETLTGLGFGWAIIIAGVLMLCYVLFGGMLATTWVQVIKASLVMTLVGVLTIFVLVRVDPNPIAVLRLAADNAPQGERFLGPGLTFSDPWNLVSMAAAVTLSSVGLPHVLMRFFTVPDAREARRSGIWAVGLIGVFNLLICFLGLSARALLGEQGKAAAGSGGNLALPVLAQRLGGGEGTVGGDLLLALVAAVGFATILAVTAGLVLSASSAVAHDLWTNLLRRHEREEPKVGRVAAVVVVLIAVLTTLAVGAGKNVTFLATLATTTAASANFPVLLLTMTWRRMTTTGAIIGALTGLVSAVVLIFLGPSAWPGAPGTAPFPLAFPVLVSVPLGFLACYLGSVLSREAPDEEAFDRVKVRALIGTGRA